VPLLEETFSTRSSAEWLAELRAVAVPCGPVNSVPAALEDPQTSARELVVQTEHPRFGTVRQVSSPVRVGQQRPVYRRAPSRHEDGADILSGLLGYDEQRITDLKSAAAFGKGLA
jgi:crotonobetainyl-CoA:carnitine CoA-transferase CaiB-like acyl-CoA transferase